MKKYIFVIFSLVLILDMFSCSDVYEEVIITDIEDYTDIWSLPERRADEASVLFTSSIIEEQCIEFSCKHTTRQMVGTGWQVVLEIQYDNATFSSEKDRLNALCADSPVCGDSEYFDILAYATVWNWNCCFEYAVVDEKEKTVSYIYLQLTEKDDLTINESYIPQGYEMNMSDRESYSIYSD